MKSRVYVDSPYVGRITGDKVTIRTFFSRLGDTYAIWTSDGFIGRYTQKSDIRAYIVSNDCRQVESH